MQGKMKALVKHRAGPGAEIRLLEIPPTGPHEVLVKVSAVSICGTDLHIFNWDRWAASRMKPPVVMGHEMAGEIVALGPEVTGWQVGDYVSAECHRTCGNCYQCRTGQAHICKDYTIMGVDFDGCFAEYVRIPETNLWKNNSRLPPESACLQDPLGNAVAALSSAPLTGKTVMITGCGAIGLFAVGVAAASGTAKIYAVDLNEYRLELARRMGAAVLLNPRRVDVVEAVMRDSAGCGVDRVIEMSGSEQCLHDGLKVVKNGGIVSLLGIPADKVSLDLADEVIFKGITLEGITGRRIFATWYITAALLDGVLDVTPVITHRMKLEDYAEAFRIMQSGQCGKIILYP